MGILKRAGTVTLLVLAVGCTVQSVPEAKDVAQGLEEFWAPCGIVKAVDFQKTNGAEQKDYYGMDVAYKLQFTSDFAKEDLWHTNPPEPVDQTRYNLESPDSAAEYAAAMADYKKELARPNEFWANHCQVELNQKYLGSIIGEAENKGIVGKDVKKGDTITVKTSFKMIKSEKGWISVE
ncbi:hypothetical protein [Acidovorax sp. sic0104]|uniref:hypothetical protein n=1 Tax=Acidovorax sp. sic0104 TaxID=2854784 RepID=UPI001C461538|nr:hypothetical protein [Acidovorax sp. sic0104]MBV7542036.1 hypothetical protein [Acidovorax sp. sic0104]